MPLESDMKGAAALAMAAWSRGMDHVGKFHQMGSVGRLEEAECFRVSAMAELEVSLDHMGIAYRKLAQAKADLEK